MFSLIFQPFLIGQSCQFELLNTLSLKGGGVGEGVTQIPAVVKFEFEFLSSPRKRGSRTFKNTLDPGSRSLGSLVRDDNFQTLPLPGYRFHRLDQEYSFVPSFPHASSGNPWVMERKISGR